MKSTQRAVAARSTRIRTDLSILLRHVVGGRRLVTFKLGAKLFSQGEKGAAVFFVRTGKVQLSVVSPQGMKAVLAILGPRDFVGEECLVSNSRRPSTATAMKASTAFRIEKRAMLKALHLDPRISSAFMNSLLARNINLEDDLTDQLFNHSEKRLACALLKLTRHGHQDKLPNAKLPRITQAKLAETVGTSREKVSGFMRKFRKLGLIQYKGSGQITASVQLLTEAVLHD
jgi:CRP/FNR family transcriptional regulator, cyclic AMP receptor protein